MSDNEYSLAQRLKELNLTTWDLTKLYCQSLLGIDATRENCRKYHTQIKRMVNNPDSVSLGNYRNLIALVGGHIQHNWIDKDMM